MNPPRTSGPLTPVSVVIPCFNAGRWIRETLASVSSQGMENLEIIVVDDGSTDNSPEIACREFPAVRLVRSEHQGPSAARNLGTELASGEFLQYLDADDCLAPGKLASQLEALLASGADVAYGDWQKLEADRSGQFRLGPEVRRQLGDRAEISLFTDFWCPPAVYLFRREMVRRVGRWNEKLPIIQDVRFALDCALQGARFVYCAGIMAYYRVHAAGSVSTGSRVEFVRDCWRNAVDIEHTWEASGGLDQARRQALIKAYAGVARASFSRDPATFEAAYEALERLQPGYIPKEPRHLAAASRLLGYRTAEYIASWYRRAKALPRGIWSSAAKIPPALRRWN